MLTTHVVSQGLAAELKSSGWPQEGSAFYWSRYDFENEHGAYVGDGKGIEAWMLVHGEDVLEIDDTFIACPLASELMERLPDFVNLSRSHRGCHASILDRDLEPIEEIADTLPDALAKLALHLMKEGKWKP